MEKYRYSNILALLLLAVVVLATIAVRFTEPISDGDIWFHLAYGRYFLENFTLIPDHSIFSWTPAENSTIYCAWIPEIIFYLLFKAGGLNLLYALRYLFILVFIMLLFSFYKKDQAGFLPGMLLICLIGLLMSCAGLRIKAELFSFLLMTIMVWAVFRIKTQPHISWPLFYLFPLIILIWVNSHGGFIFGIVFLGLVLIGEILNSVSGTSDVLHPGFRKHILISFILTGFALFITPYGWNYPVQLLNKLIINPAEFTSHMRTIAEYQTIFFSQASHLHFIDYLIVSSAILIFLLIVQLRRHKTDWTLLLVNISFLIIYIKLIRATYYWAIIFVFSSCYIISQLTQNDSGFSIKKPLKAVIRSITLVLLLLIAIRVNYETFCAPTISFKTNYISPESEAAFISKNFPSLLMGNDYASGSYLLWSLWPTKKVFIDARYFPYSKWYHEEGEFEYYQDKARMDIFLNIYKCNIWCLTWHTPALKYFITSPDWRLVYYGPAACVFLSKKIAFPENKRFVAKSIYDVDVYQAYTITKFASLAGDIDVSKNIVASMKPNPLSPQQIKFAIRAKFNVGNNLYEKSRYYDAIQVYSDALLIVQESLLPKYFLQDDISQDLAMIHNNLGCSFMNINRLGEAANELTEALKIRPDLDIAQKYLPKIMARITKADDAISKLKNALNKNPNDLNLLNSLASNYSIKGQYDNALDSLMKGLIISPENASIYYNIACIYSKQNRFKESITYLDKAMIKGFNNWDLLKKDHDLDNIRNTPFFKRIISEKTGFPLPRE